MQHAATSHAHSYTCNTNLQAHVAHLRRGHLRRAAGGGLQRRDRLAALRQLAQQLALARLEALDAPLQLLARALGV